MNDEHAFLRSLLPPEFRVSSRWSNTTIPSLYPVEQEAIAKAVPKRKREFALGRMCARDALGQLGVAPVAIAVGNGRAPQWPDGYVGSITHCEGFIGAVAAARDDFLGVGLDVERIADLEPGVVERVCTADELTRLSKVVGVHGSLIAFCAKEAVHKCIFPAWGAALDFLDVEISLSDKNAIGEVGVHPVTSVAERWDLSRLRGAFCVLRGVVGAAVWLRAE